MPRLSKNLEDSLERERDQYAKDLQMAARSVHRWRKFLTLFSAPNPTYLGNEVQQFEVDTVHKYNCYRLLCLEAEPSNPGLSYMQLFIYSD